MFLKNSQIYTNLIICQVLIISQSNCSQIAGHFVKFCKICNLISESNKNYAENLKCFHVFNFYGEFNCVE